MNAFTALGLELSSKESVLFHKNKSRQAVFTKWDSTRITKWDSTRITFWRREVSFVEKIKTGGGVRNGQIIPAGEHGQRSWGEAKKRSRTTKRSTVRMQQQQQQNPERSDSTKRKALHGVNPPGWRTARKTSLCKPRNNWVTGRSSLWVGLFTSS